MRRKGMRRKLTRKVKKHLSIEQRVSCMMLRSLSRFSKVDVILPRMHRGLLTYATTYLSLSLQLTHYPSVSAIRVIENDMSGTFHRHITAGAERRSYTEYIY